MDESFGGKPYCCKRGSSTRLRPVRVEESRRSYLLNFAYFIYSLFSGTVGNLKRNGMIQSNATNSLLLRDHARFGDIGIGQ